jgi:predicted ribosomally synthesized peptide with SipW-like signal peptide
MNSKSKGIFFTFTLIVIGALLIGGATVAWFTSTAENTRNSFQSGTLNIKLDREQGNYYFDIHNIAPGDQDSQPIVVSNTGSLDLVYQISYTIAGVLAEGEHPLEIQIFNISEECIDQGFDRRLTSGQQEVLTITWKMPEEAGNEYQGGTAQFDLLVKASQVSDQADHGSSQYNFRELSPKDFANNGTWTTTERGFYTPIPSAYNDSTLFIPNDRESYTLVSRATLGLGSHSTNTSGGYGIFFETSFSGTGVDTGYILQFDRAYQQIHIRRRINGQEHRPIAVVTHAENGMIPTDRRDPWWTSEHRIDIQVTPSVTDSDVKYVTVRIDQVDIFNHVEIVGLSAAYNHTGLRTWLSEADFHSLSID